MSDKNDFDFEDDFLSDDNEPFDFEEEEGFSSGLGDEFGSDMPEIEEEPEERGANRTFVFLAGIMIILFVAALAVVLFLATRTTGPSDLELTASQVVLLNLTVEAQLAGTSTQNAINFGLTQTAAAWTATPSPTLTPSETLTPTPTEFRPTITPTPSQDLTQLAILQLANGALTLTWMAENATATPSPAPTDPLAGLDLQSAFATQVAYATQQGQFDQELFGTRVAIATSIANTSIDTAGELALRNSLDATQGAISTQSGAAATAIAFIDSALAESAQQNSALATQLALVIPAGLQTQAALGTPFAQATIDALGTQAVLGTLSADQNRNVTPGASIILPPSAAKVDQQEIDRVQQDGTQAVIGTRDAFAAQAAVSTLSAIGTQQSLATQMAFSTPPVFATQAAIATQVGLATRQALINMALGQSVPTQSGGGLEAVNMTATAIAGAFLTATAQAFTPGAVTITAPPQAAFATVAPNLPQTGLFDDVVNGGSNTIGVLALAVFGLVGVIAVSRRLRSGGDASDRSESSDAQEPPKQE